MWYRPMQLLLECHGVINTDPVAHWECTIRICKVIHMGMEKGCIPISIHGSYAAPVLFIKFGIYPFVIDGKMSPVTNGYTQGCSGVKTNSQYFLSPSKAECCFSSSFLTWEYTSLDKRDSEIPHHDLCCSLTTQRLKKTSKRIFH